MDLYRTLLEDFAQEVEIYLANDPDSEELHRLSEDIDGLLNDLQY